MGIPKNPTSYQIYITRQRESNLGQKSWNKGINDNPQSWLKRFTPKYQVINNCWLWQGRIEPNGYGKFWKDGKTIYAHVFSYEFFNGIIPETMTVDHLCKNKSCVNPFHLDLATRVDNVLRGNNEIARNKTKTHCPQGHEYKGENLYSAKDGSRKCNMCMKFKHAKRNAERKYLKRGIIIHWL